ncbi:hypothetical protein HWV62_11956 [Athelia sp. TMB]|nr:hypothetical protein HWV62_11956 [Athelia sp. TMB]
MHPHINNLNEAIDWLHSRGMTPASFLVGLLSSDAHAAHALELFQKHFDYLLQGLSIYAGQELLAAARSLVNEKYAQEIIDLTNIHTGLHFWASKANVAQVAAFDLEIIGATMCQQTPGLWDMLGVLLSADPSIHERRTKEGQASAKWVRKFLCSQKAMETESDDLTAAAAAAIEDDRADSEAEYWRDTALLMEVATSEELLFLRACQKPWSNSTSINRMVKSLSSESTTEMKQRGHTLLASYAYDNDDIDLKHGTPTGEALHETHIHLMSGTMIALKHGITPMMLQCSEMLWKKQRHNPGALQRDIPQMTTYTHLLNIHPEDDNNISGLMRCERFFVWVFLRDLIVHGPEYFRQFRQMLGRPETIDKIPIVRSRQVPVQMMDINPSTTNNNITALEDLFRQGGVGDSSESQQSGVRDIGDQVILIHGDLLTGERIQSLQATCSEEATPWRHFQFVVYVMGLFHLKMVCADAIWWMHIQLLRTRGKEGAKRASTNSLMSHVSIIRPRETGKMESKPGFRRVHKTVEHVGAVSRLDCWRLVAMRAGCGVQTLKDFAALLPRWEELQAMATQLVLQYVASPDTFPDLRSQPLAIRNQEHEKLLLRQQHFLLYEEMSYAMNEGDIGRVEDAFMPWVFIFKGCGKHKYAAQMIRYLHNVHFIYSEGLK